MEKVSYRVTYHVVMDVSLDIKAASANEAHDLGLQKTKSLMKSLSKARACVGFYEEPTLFSTV
jgi:hypothetical protein